MGRTKLSISFTQNWETTIQTDNANGTAEHERSHASQISVPLLLPFLLLKVFFSPLCTKEELLEQKVLGTPLLLPHSVPFCTVVRDFVNDISFTFSFPCIVCYRQNLSLHLE